MIAPLTQTRLAVSTTGSRTASTETHVNDNNILIETVIETVETTMRQHYLHHAEQTALMMSPHLL